MNKSINFEVQHLEILSFFLNFELSSSVLFALSFFYPVMLFLSIWASILFAPFMLYVLVKEKKFGWITIFLITIIKNGSTWNSYKKT